MSFFIRIFVFALVALSVSTGVRAQAADDVGMSNIPYIGMDVGLSLSSAEIETTDNDVPSACDVHYAGEDGIDPTSATNFATLDDCRDGSSNWTNDFGTGFGSSIGITTGISKIGGLPVRGELEYIYSNNKFNEKIAPDFGGAKAPEFDPELGGQLYGELGSVASHNVFANLYYDLELEGSSFTPYVGLGVGWSRTNFDMVHFFQRNRSDDEPAPSGSTGHPATRNLDADGNCTPVATDDCVVETLEGVISYANDTHDDSTFGLQFLLGFDYPLSDRISAGVKLRWAYFGDIEGDNKKWDTLRSHESTVAPDAENIDETLGRSNIVTYKTTLENKQVWGAAFSLKYKFF